VGKYIAWLDIGRFIVWKLWVIISLISILNILGDKSMGTHFCATYNVVVVVVVVVATVVPMFQIRRGEKIKVMYHIL
jgi:hypothetical protein